jgi:hypothetical protein
MSKVVTVVLAIAVGLLVGIPIGSANPAYLMAGRVYSA